MPKQRKTRKQKLQASMRQHPVPSTVVQPTSSVVSSSQPIAKTPEKFSLNVTKMQNTVSVMGSHTYLKGELSKTAMLSAGILICELLFFFLLRNHIIVLSGLSY
ncbi:MAG TPA: hypothetical protein VLG12_08285 [Candidatus Saccharimonadales bacterium]|nr:hypothetical protein [Candidatus Saccharimonadales bacterium]